MSVGTRSFGRSRSPSIPVARLSSSRVTGSTLFSQKTRVHEFSRSLSTNLSTVRVSTVLETTVVSTAIVGEHLCTFSEKYLNLIAREAATTHGGKGDSNLWTGFLRTIDSCARFSESLFASRAHRSRSVAQSGNEPKLRIGASDDTRDGDFEMFQIDKNILSWFQG